jgi:hypothetical protein
LTRKRKREAGSQAHVLPVILRRKEGLTNQMEIRRQN